MVQLGGWGRWGRTLDMEAGVWELTFFTSRQTWWPWMERLYMEAQESTRSTTATGWEVRPTVPSRALSSQGYQDTGAGAHAEMACGAPAKAHRKGLAGVRGWLL